MRSNMAFLPPSLSVSPSLSLPASPAEVRAWALDSRAMAKDTLIKGMSRPQGIKSKPLRGRGLGEVPMEAWGLQTPESGHLLTHVTLPLTKPQGKLA